MKNGIQKALPVCNEPLFTQAKGPSASRKKHPHLSPPEADNLWLFRHKMTQNPIRLKSSTMKITSFVFSALNVLSMVSAQALQDTRGASSPAVQALINRLDEQQQQIIALQNKVNAQNATSAPTTASFSSITIGSRWTLRQEGDVLVFRDNLTGGDKRYAFYPGGFSDMYTTGRGGTIGAKAIQLNDFIIREEFPAAALVIRSSKSTGDKRYAFWANKFVDL